MRCRRGDDFTTRLIAPKLTELLHQQFVVETRFGAQAASPGYDMPAWHSIMGPAGVRREIAVALNGAIARTLEMPDVREKMINGGSEAAASSTSFRSVTQSG